MVDFLMDLIFHIKYHAKVSCIMLADLLDLFSLFAAYDGKCFFQTKGC